MGFFRVAGVIGGNGALQKCTNPVHFTGPDRRVGQLCEMDEQDRKIRLSDIRPLPGNKEMLDACRGMLARPYGWLYIHGMYGNAKTVALKAMCNHFRLNGYGPVVYINFSTLADIVREAESMRYSKGAVLQKNGNLELWDNGPIDLFQFLLSIKVLGVEEFDKARLTPIIEEFRFRFLDARYDQAVKGKTITMFASQSAPENLGVGALASRIRHNGFYVAHNTAGDSRGVMPVNLDVVCLP